MAQRKIYFDDGSLQREIARAYEVIAECKDVLEQSRPDTFLGRQRHEPIPPSYDGYEATASGADGSRPADLPSNDHSPVSDETP